MKIPAPLTEPDLLRLRYFLSLTRSLEDRLSALYRQGTITATVFSGRGQEAISVGSAFALEPQDSVSAITRDLGTLLVRGISARDVFTQYMGKATSPTGGKERIHYFGDLARGIIASISVLGDMIPVMAGIALANRSLGRNAVALTYLGDGAVSTGAFHEGMNMASVLKLPLVLIIENNGYAYSTPVSHQSAVPDLAVKARCYGIPGVTIDGNDVLEVYRTTREALEAARRGDGPMIIEAKTMRMKGHSDADNARYQPKGQLEEWKKRDPLERFDRLLRENDLLSDSDHLEMENRIRELLEADLEFALSSPFPDPKSTLDGVYGS
jgi:TPP-dependent pyruvate/acetoin dehydrogenase alpha subunit